MADQLNFKFELGGDFYECDLDSDLSISKETLDDDCIDQASLYAWYAVLSENARDLRDRAKERIKLVRAQLDVEVRQTMLDAKEKITDSKASLAIDRHERYQEAVSQHLDASRTHGILSAAVEAFVHRKSMLITLGANMRTELEGEVVIKEESSAGDDAIQRMKRRMREKK